MKQLSPQCERKSTTSNIIVAANNTCYPLSTPAEEKFLCFGIDAAVKLTVPGRDLRRVPRNAYPAPFW